MPGVAKSDEGARGSYRTRETCPPAPAAERCASRLGEAHVALHVRLRQPLRRTRPGNDARIQRLERRSGALDSLVELEVQLDDEAVGVVLLRAHPQPAALLAIVEQGRDRRAADVFAEVGERFSRKVSHGNSALIGSTSTRQGRAIIACDWQKRKQFPKLSRRNSRPRPS